MSGEWSSVDRINEIIRAINERSLVVNWSDGGLLDPIEVGEDLQDPVFWSGLQSRAHFFLSVSLDPIEQLQSQTVMPLDTTPTSNGAYHLAGLDRHGWTRRYPRTLSRAFNGDLVGLGRDDGPPTLGVAVEESTATGIRRFVGALTPFGFGSDTLDEGEPPLIFWDRVFSGAPTWPLEGWRARLEPDNVFYDRVGGEWVVSDDQQSPPDLIESFGQMRANDYVGPWIVEELEAVLRACAGRSYQLRTFGEAASSLDWTIQAISFFGFTLAEVYQLAVDSLVDSHSAGGEVLSGTYRYNRLTYVQNFTGSALRAAVQSGGIAATTEAHPPGLPAIQSIQAFTTLFERSPTGPGDTLQTVLSDRLEWFGSASIPAGSSDSVSCQSPDFSIEPNPLPIPTVDGPGQHFSEPDLLGFVGPSGGDLRAIGAPQFQHLT